MNRIVFTEVSKDDSIIMSTSSDAIDIELVEMFYRFALAVGHSPQGIRNTMMVFCEEHNE